VRRPAAFLPSLAATVALAAACGGCSGRPPAGDGGAPVDNKGNPPATRKLPATKRNGVILGLPTFGPAEGDLRAVALKVEITPWQAWGDTAAVEEAFTEVAKQRLKALGVRVVTQPAKPALVITYREAAGPKYERHGEVVTSTVADLTVSLDAATPAAAPHQRTLHLGLQKLEFVRDPDAPEKRLHELVVGNALRSLYETWLPLGKQVAAVREVHRSPPLLEPDLSRIGARYAYYFAEVKGKAPAGLPTIRIQDQRHPDIVTFAAVQAVSLKTFKSRALFPRAHPFRPTSGSWRALPFDADDATANGLFWCGPDRLCRACGPAAEGARQDVPCSRESYELDAPARMPAPAVDVPFLLARAAARFDTASWKFVPLPGGSSLTHHERNLFAELGGPHGQYLARGRRRPSQLRPARLALPAADQERRAV
jgi:hypothetical protein